jgi:histidine triad (HIT) family protein
MPRKILRVYLLIICSILFSNASIAQSAKYETKKADALAEKSVFEKIVDKELPATILYEDEEIIAFIPLRKQAPIHILIIPKERIVSVNEIEDEQALLIGNMFIVARNLAKEYKIDQSGYRLVLNNNEDAGQSVFHLHMHLLGGKKLGPMTIQDFIDPNYKK